MRVVLERGQEILIFAAHRWSKAVKVVAVKRRGLIQATAAV